MSNDAFAILVQSSAIDALGELTPKIRRNMVRAVNKTVERARPAAAAEIRQQVAFSARYLSGAQGRLAITQRASESDPTAVLTGRRRPTSLARFATNARRSRVPGARVTVQPGLSRFLPRAFFIPLRSGADGSNNNLGLAIRLPAGTRPSRAYKPQLIGTNLWLLYGPSVDQVFDDVAAEMVPESSDFLEREFLRLMDLDLA